MEMTEQQIQSIRETLKVISEGTVRPNKNEHSAAGVVRDAIDAKPLIKCLYDRLAELHGVDAREYENQKARTSNRYD